MLIIVGLFLASYVHLPNVQGKPSQLMNKDGVCDTEGCKKTAERLLNSMNRTVNPCSDFYEYSCGNWMKNNPIPSTSSRWNQFSILDKELNNRIQDIMASPIDDNDDSALIRVKKFYSACKDLGKDGLNKSGLKPLAKVLRDYGSFPIIERENWTASNFSLPSVLGRLRKNFGLNFLAEISVRPDMKNTERNLLYFDQPEFFLSRDYLLNPVKFQARHNAYRKFAHDAIIELNNQEMNPENKIEEDYLNTKVNEIIQFEMKLANISVSEEERRNVQKTYHLFKLREFQNYNEMTNMNWKEILQEIFEQTKSIGEDEDIVVLQPQYLKKMGQIVADTPSEVVANYIQWRLMAGLLGETTDRMRQIQFEFERTMTGLQEPEAREVECSNVELSSQYYSLGYAVGVKYLDKYFPSESKERVNEMVGYLRQAFETFLKEADWMDGPTKEKAMGKIKAMSQFIGYPNWMKNGTAVDLYFAELEVNENHFQNYLNYLGWRSNKELKTLRKTPKRDEMDSHPVYVNAQYAPEMNSITFPAGILASPFFSQDSPASINFGGIGVVIGHEVTHGFDDEGSQFDDKGNAKNWWSETIREEFDSRAKCMIDQYSQFETLHGHVNGAMTAGENIADNGGLRQSLKGYHDWLQQENGGRDELRLPGLEDLNSQQLFFLGFSTVWCQNVSPQAEQNLLLTDVHSPGKFRVWGTVQNSENFATAWNCPKNSPMNPDKKCKLW